MTAIVKEYWSIDSEVSDKLDVIISRTELICRNKAEGESVAVEYVTLILNELRGHTVADDADASNQAQAQAQASAQSAQEARVQTTVPTPTLAAAAAAVQQRGGSAQKKKRSMFGITPVLRKPAKDAWVYFFRNPERSIKIKSVLMDVLLEVANLMMKAWIATPTPTDPSRAIQPQDPLVSKGRHFMEELLQLASMCARAGDRLVQQKGEEDEEAARKQGLRVSPRGLPMDSTTPDGRAIIGSEGKVSDLEGELMRKYVAVRNVIMQEMRKWDKIPFTARATLMSLSDIWNSMRSDDDACQLRIKNGPVMSFNELLSCRESRLSILRTYRERVEESLRFELFQERDPSDPDGRMMATGPVNEVSLLHVPDHLFTTATYFKMFSFITEFVSDVSIKKAMHQRMLQKRFELEALKEVRNTLFEVAGYTKKLATALRATGISGLKSAIVSIENIEWVCRRTWQEDWGKKPIEDRATLFEAIAEDLLESDVFRMNPNMSLDAHLKKLFAEDDQALDRGAKSSMGAVQSTQAISGLFGGGGGGPDQQDQQQQQQQENDNNNNKDNKGGQVEVNRTLGAFSEGDDMKVGLRDVLLQIVKARRLLVETWTQVRQELLRISTYGIPKRGISDVFMRDVVVPRIRAIVNAIERMVRVYCAPPYDPPVGDEGIPQLDRNGRIKKAEAWDTADVPREPTTVGDRISADATFRILYFTKVIRIIVQVIALMVAQRAYSQLHTRIMIGEGSESPPRLESIMFTALAIDATIQLVVLVILVLISYIGKTGSNSFMVDDQFIQIFLIEYFVTTVLLVAFGYLIASIAQKKTYFSLQTDGQSGSMAYRDILIGTASVVGLVPWYLIIT